MKIQKTTFSEYEFDIKDLSKALNISTENVCQYIKEHKEELSKVKSFEKYTNVDEVFEEYYLLLRCELEGLTTNFPHYFVTGKGMEKWLLNSAPPMSMEKIKNIPPTMCDIPVRMFFIHFEKEEFSSSTTGCYMVCFLENDGFVVIESPRKIITILHKDRWEEFQKDKTFNTDAFNVVSGFLSYLQCFPETVKEGVPESIKFPDRFRYIKQACQISTSHIQTDGTVKPHFRNGHFRFLQSEKFTHKRFQTVWVKDAFIKGTPETVLCPEDYDKMCA